MSKPLAIIIVILFIAAIGLAWSFIPPTTTEAPSPILPTPSPSPLPSPVFPKACTQEAKLCPDGSAVGRTGPNCEFAQCPSNPIGRECNGPSDMTCPSNYECVQGCGPPVVRYPDDTPPAYFCQLKGYNRPCPICLAQNTLIGTPLGAIKVQDLLIGMPIWTVNTSGHRVLGAIIKTSQTPVSPDHKMVELVLEDGRTLLVSPGHPTTDGRTVGDLAPGDVYNGSQVVSADRVSYGGGFTYDILPGGQTGFYFANGILLDSTLSSVVKY